MTASETAADTRALATTIVAAYVGGNKIPKEEVPPMLQSVHATLRSLVDGTETATLRPAVARSQSIKREYLVCLEDGKKMKCLKRYLRNRYDMTPGAYRIKWGLPSDYPMTCPAYSAQRSAFAKSIGLGRRRP